MLYTFTFSNAIPKSGSDSTSDSPGVYSIGVIGLGFFSGLYSGVTVVPVGEEGIITSGSCVAILVYPTLLHLICNFNVCPPA